MIYLDSSALLTLLTGRPNAGALRRFLADRPGLPIATSTIGVVETVRQLDKVGSFPNALADLDAMVTEILLTEEVRDLAARVPASLRSLDAIHVASALDAAREAGLAAFAPGMAD